LRILILFFIFLGIPFLSFSQQLSPKDTLSVKQADSLFVSQDSLAVSDSARADSTISDSTRTDSTAKEPGDIKTYINYSATDSIRFDVISKIIYLYGKAKVTYGDMDLKAEQIEVNWSSNIITATGAYDTAGKYIGRPVFSQTGGLYEADTIKYNILTKKGLIVNVVTQEGEGYIHANKGKKDEYNNVYFSHAKYTTCNLAHPHFYIGANKLKVIPDDKVVSGPFNLYIADVPVPLGFIFGFFPIPNKRKSGIIFPRDFGEHQTRGFYFTQGGYYIAVKDYAGISLTADAYSNGSWQGNLETNYKKRYHFSGRLGFNYGKIKQNFDSEEKDPFLSNFNLDWQHVSETQGLSSFSANVHLSSFSYDKNFSYDPALIIRPAVISSINYSTSFRNTPFSLNVQLYEDQGQNSKIITTKLPAITFGMRTIYPFKKKINSKSNWFENIGVKYQLNTELDVTNRPTPIGILRANSPEAVAQARDTLRFSLGSLDSLLNRAQYGATHTFNIGTSIKPKKTFLKYFSVNPSLSYTDYWYMEHLAYNFDPLTQKLDTTLTRGFSRAGTFNGGVSLTTQIYGTYKFKNTKLKAIRHAILPNVGFSYQPDFSDPLFNTYYSYTPEGQQERHVSKFAGFLYGGPGQGEQNRLNFSIDNTLEAKIATKDTANPTKKIQLLNRFGIRSSYNFAADSFQLENFSVYASTRLLGIFDISYSGNIDPYRYRLDSVYGSNGSLFVAQTRTKDLGFNTAKSDNTRWGFFSNSLSIGATFTPEGFKRKKIDQPLDEVTAEELAVINAHPNLYVDFNIPWTLNMSYIYTINNRGFDFVDIQQTISAQGDIKLTNAWKVGFETAYDLTNKGLSASRFSVYRDLHCWQMSISFGVGIQQYYSFTISPKAGILQDLRLNKRSPGAFGQPPLF